MRIRMDRCGRVEASHEIRLPLPASTAWGQMRDYARFLALDPLHVRVRLVAPGPNSPRGDELIISHRLAGCGPDRRGRVLTWHEGRGYAISDLSRRSLRSGFPHICTYELREAGPEQCRLILGARGRWTARWMPRPLAKFWLWWVLRSTGARIVAELTAFRVWRNGPRDS